MDIVNILNNIFNYLNKNYTLKDIIRMFVKNTLEIMSDSDSYKRFIYYEG